MTFWHPDITLEDGPHAIAITRGEWIDTERDKRKIPYKLYTPKDISGTVPLIIWSHGLGGSKDGAGFISRFMASHGYAVMNVQHHGTDTSLWMGKDGHPWDVIRDTTLPWEAIENRLLDIPFALNTMAANNDGSFDFSIIDLDRAGMSGHSMGAMTTQAIAGQYYGPNDSAIRQYKDSRFKAALAYSQLPSWVPDADHTALYSGIDKPIFFMTGTQDDSPVSGHGYEVRLKVFEGASSAIKHMLVINDADHMVFAGSRGQLTGYDKIPLHEDIIKISSLAWWDWHLKGSEDAKSWLQNNFKTWLYTEGSFV